MKAILNSGLQIDKALIVDDGSPILPNWSRVAVVSPGRYDDPIPEGVSIHHFDNRLGRDVDGQPFPGWYRSFAYAIMSGIRGGFDRIVHIESDAFLISGRAVKFFNECDRGWVSLWCRSYQWPESTMQIINKDSFKAAEEFFSRPYSDYTKQPYKPMEKLLPITSINKDLVGDRYGEISDSVPLGADYVSQVRWGQPESYYWWLENPRFESSRDLRSSDLSQIEHKYRCDYQITFQHQGVSYLEFMTFLDREMCPLGYLEIGTENGASLAKISCDAISVDPRFKISQDVIGRREKMFFFQKTSDDFFRDHDPRLFLEHLDLSMLDGLHHFEALLRDFINFERSSHIGSMALLHDCLPLNVRMTSRHQETGPASEDEITRGFWTGDVWRVLLILTEFRPDLNVVVLDCPPTGLVLCSGLDSTSDILSRCFTEIVDRYTRLDLAGFGLETLWKIKPMLSSQKIIADPQAFCERFRFR
ncbi:hypothetical protein [Rhodopila sp.]|uniref:hypothetical protein n=1 Tax=Rhodopila sp. TaxID=2480087 RepID=UPI003D0CA622